MSAPDAREHESLEVWLVRAREFSERALERHFASVVDDSSALAQAMRYALFAPGKRLRPSLVLLVAEGLGSAPERAELASVAIEMVHTYSLIHDDLPCMDDDALRRGRPTCHVVFGEALALLAGDALLTAAFECVARAPREIAAESAAVLARAAGARGMVLGQAQDLALGANATLDDVRSMHARKTGALITAACELGALVAGASAAQRELSSRYGRALGAAFQAVDDVLDVTGDSQSLGKTPGKDQKLERATLVRVAGLDGARRVAEEAGDAARRAGLELGWSASHPGIQLVEHLLRRTR